MRLVITGTDLVGQGIPHLDSFGNRLDDTEHRAHFLFSNDPGGPADNDFARKHAGDRLGDVSAAVAAANTACLTSDQRMAYLYEYSWFARRRSAECQRELGGRLVAR